VDRIKQEAGQWAQLLPAMPRLAHRALLNASQTRTDPPYETMLRQLVREQRRTRIALWLVVAVVSGLIAVQLWLALRPGH
jgi:ubiquinone biosynthesis protein